MEETFTKCILAFKSLNCRKSFISSVVDKLLTFMFHSLPQPSLGEWYITAVLDGPNSLMEYISPAQYRHYLLLMLYNNSDSTDASNSNVCLDTHYNVFNILNFLVPFYGC